ncbi:MAG: oligosaccharide flippase family protein, partial [Candidatus Cloacimonadota bacterium]|nr:oligosaccharide flippase family protein [Candidatus Cloacimonadota bacterium]
MLERIKTTVKHSIIYSIGNLFTKVIGLILLPLYTSHLSTSDYGMLGILEVTAQFMIIVLGLNIYQAMMRWFAEQESEFERKSLIFTSFVSLFLLSGSILFLLSLFQNQAAILFFDKSSFSIFFVYLFIWVFLEILNTVPLSILRLKERSVLYIGFLSFKFIVVLCLNIYFVAYKNMGIEGILLGQLLGSLLLFVLNIPVLLANFRLKFQFEIIKQMFGFSFPLIFSSISVMLLSMGDRFIIRYLLDFSEVGIYSLAYKIAGVINVFIINSFSLSFLPIAYKAFNTKGAREFYKKIFKYFSFILIFSALALSLFSEEILRIFARDPAYWKAAKFVPLLTLTFIFKGTQYILGLGFHYIKKTKYNAYIVMSG